MLSPKRQGEPVLGHARLRRGGRDLIVGNAALDARCYRPAHAVTHRDRRRPGNAGRFGAIDANSFGLLKECGDLRVVGDASAIEPAPYRWILLLCRSLASGQRNAGQP